MKTPWRAKTARGVAGEDGRSVGQRVGVEGGPARDEPPRFSEPARSVDPTWSGNVSLSREKFREASETGVKSSLSGERGLFFDQSHLAWSRRTSVIVGEAEKQT